MSWQRLSTQVLLHHARLTVYEDTVQLPSGYRTTYIRVEKPTDAAMVIAVNEDHEILVQREYSYPPNQWLYQFPGGALESEESPLEGAHREFAEEAGYNGQLQEIGWFYVDNRRCKNKFYVFVAKDLVKCKTIGQDPEEAFEDYWLTQKQIEAMIKNGTVTNYSFLAGWSLYRAYYVEKVR